MTLVEEEIKTNVEILLDKLFPKSMYEGDFITVENTVEGLKADVVADEETRITVCNKNVISFKQENWDTAGRIFY